MKKDKYSSCTIKRIIFIGTILIFFFSAGVLAGNLKPMNSVKIEFSNNHVINVLTAKTKISEILEENHIEVLEDEIVVPGLNAEITDNNSIKISKLSETNTIAQLAATGESTTLDELLTSYAPIVEKYVVLKEEIPYETIRKDISGNATNKTETVAQSGANGIREVVYKIKYQNDVEIERIEISNRIIKNPVNKVVNVQTKKTATTTTTSRSSASRTENNTTKKTTGLESLVQGITPKVKSLNASAYCSCKACCGKTNAITASGVKASTWYTVAAGSDYPIGTIIYIPALKNKPNGGWFIVQDRGGAVSNSKIDIFVSNHSEALNFGRKNLECYIYVK